MGSRAALVAASLALVAADRPGQPPPGSAASQDPMNGFAITRQLVDREKIIPGGPPRDGIHSIDAPAFAGAGAGDAVAAETPVLGVSIGGAAHAYLIPILEYHQIVNDAVGGVPIAVTYDPLTGVPRAFKRTVDGRELHFGVSGLLYNSGFLLFDRETESLWSQFQGRAISGPLAGKVLERVPVRREEFGSWLKSEPKTRILIPPDPDKLDYNTSPYEGYSEKDGSAFPVEARDRRFHAKELVLGVVINGKARAYLASLVTRAGGKLEDEFQGRKMEVAYAPDTTSFRWSAPADVDVTEAYWFAWKAFHPDTEIWHDPGKVEGREP